MKESVATSWRMSSIGNSGARSSGPTGWSVPGCSGGGGGVGRSGITLYHWRGISDSSSVILVRSATRPSDLQGNTFPNPTLLVPNPLCWPGLAHQGLDGRGHVRHRLLGVGEVHAGLGVGVQLVIDPRVAVPHRALDHDDGLG